jgi:hypothetical protein
MAGLAFSILSTGVFLVPLLQGLLKPNQTKATVVAFTVGSTGIAGQEGRMGGNPPQVTVYTEDGSRIGSTGDINVDTTTEWHPGSTQYISINPEKGMEGKQATYVSVQAGGSNEICISAISVAWPDGSSPKVWLGDIGVNCSTAADGPEWSNSVTQTGSDPQFQSKCIWLTTDPLALGIHNEGINLHIVDFGRTDGATTRDGAQTTNPVALQWNSDNDLLCKAPGRMTFVNRQNGAIPILVYQPPLEYLKDGTDQDPFAVMHGACDPTSPTADCGGMEHLRRPVVTNSSQSQQNLSDRRRRGLNRRNRYSKTLVHSNSTSHSAEMLCNSPASIGPDFVSYRERKFCDMSSRTIWPLCSNNIMTECFDYKSNRLIKHSRQWNETSLERRYAYGGETYERVEHW